jgi:hypothetical protein
MYYSPARTGFNGLATAINNDYDSAIMEFSGFQCVVVVITTTGNSTVFVLGNIYNDAGVLLAQTNLWQPALVSIAGQLTLSMGPGIGTWTGITSSTPGACGTLVGVRRAGIRISTQGGAGAGTLTMSVFCGLRM